MFKARNRKTGEYVAIRKMRGGENAERVQRNYEILKDLDCPCIAKCYGLIPNGKELWVVIKACA